MLVELDEYQLTIMGIEIQKKVSGGFIISVTVEFKGEERILGFWHGRDTNAVYYAAENGCLMDVTLFCQERCPRIDICGGFDCTNPELYSAEESCSLLRDSSKEKAIMGATPSILPCTIPLHSLLWNFLAFSHEGISTNDCAGILMIEVDRWLEESSWEERAIGVDEILYSKRIRLDELDYDYVSGEWNFT
jgi:hypothetical protein